MNAPKIFPCRANSAELFQGSAIPLAMMIMMMIMMTAPPAFAGLGQDVSSVPADQVQMKGTLRSTQNQAYAVHEIRAATGTVVREYVSPSGKVFGVAWQGPWPPNMRQILATYFEQYQRAVQVRMNSRPGRRPLMLEQPGLVVQSSGHMRSFAGRAYVPDMLPPEVSAEAIR